MGLDQWIVIENERTGIKIKSFYFRKLWWLHEWMETRFQEDSNLSDFHIHLDEQDIKSLAFDVEHERQDKEKEKKKGNRFFLLDLQKMCQELDQNDWFIGHSIYYISSM